MAYMEMQRSACGTEEPYIQYRLGTDWDNSILQKRTWVASWPRICSLQCAIAHSRASWPIQAGLRPSG